jgi:hypothetical protein
MYALAVDSVGDGMLRPFLLLYGVTALRMSLQAAGLALTAGFIAGLLVLPFAGRWLDRGARRGLASVALLVRTAGLVVMLIGSGSQAFTVAAVLLGIGSQTFPPAHAAVVASLAEGRDRDAALAFARALRNGGMGLGALGASIAVSQGVSVMRSLAAGAAVMYLVAAATVASMPVATVSAEPSPPPPNPPKGGDATPPGMLTLLAANLPFALCFEVLEVALPAVLVTQLHVSPVWAAALFVGNTTMVVLTQLMVVQRLARFQRRAAFAASGALLALSYLGFLGASNISGTTGAALICLFAVVFTAGEIVYTGAGVALVTAAAEPGRLGRELARWQLSTGLSRAAAPLLLTSLLTIGATVLWAPLAAATAFGAWVVYRHGPRDAPGQHVHG